MAGPRRYDSAGHRKFRALVETEGSLVAVARKTAVAYSRLRALYDGREPRLSDASRLACFGIDVGDWGVAPERQESNPEATLA